MFAPECWPPAGAEAIVTCKLLMAAKKKGWDIDVLCHADAGIYYPADTEALWKSLLPIVYQIKPSRFFGSVRRLAGLSWAFRAASRAREMHRRQPYDVILSRIMPQYGHLPALIVSRNLKIPWVANWSDPMPRLKAPSPYGKGPGARIPSVIDHYIKAVSYQVDWHTFPSERLRKYICSYLPECEPKSSVIPHIASAMIPQVCQKEDDRFTLCHTGGLGIRKPHIFLEGVKLFLERTAAYSQLQVHFIGPHDEHLMRSVSELGLTGVVSICQPVAYAQSLKALAEATVAIVIEAQMDEGIFLPAKVTDIVQTARPILALSPNKSTLRDIVESYGGGIAVDNTSPEAVCRALETFYGAWTEGKIDSRFGSDRLEPLFSEKTILGYYDDIFAKISKL